MDFLNRVGLGVFNVGLDLRKWAIADRLGFIPKDDPDICHRNFGTPKDIIWMGIFHSRRLLHPPGAISVHGSFRQASLEPGPTGQELRTLP